MMTYSVGGKSENVLFPKRATHIRILINQEASLNPPNIDEGMCFYAKYANKPEFDILSMQ